MRRYEVILEGLYLIGFYAGFILMGSWFWLLEIMENSVLVNFEDLFDFFQCRDGTASKR